MYVAVVDT